MSLFNDNQFCIILQEADFPSYFIDKHHPDDYKSNENPIQELIYHIRTNHNRLICHISVRISENQYIPLTFVCDTGAPMFLYINEITRRLICKRIKLDDSENEIIIVNGKKMTINDSPSNHKDVNIMGIRALSWFGLYLDKNTFGFTELPDYI